MILNTEAQLPILREAPILRGSAAMVPDPSLLTLDPSKLSRVTYCGTAADTAKPILKELSAQLTESLRHPCSKTLKLLDRALRLLIPFESPKAAVASPAEKQQLLDLIVIHRTALSPYLDLDRIERNLRQRY